MTLSHPEFVECIEAKVADAVMRRLEADTAIRRFCSGGVYAVELEEIFVEGGLTYTPPALLLAIDATEERFLIGAGGEVTTILRLGLILPVHQVTGTEAWLRARVINHLKLILMADPDGDGLGVLRDEAGELCTDGLLVFQRGAQPVWDRARGQIRIPITVAYRSTTDRNREFIP